MISTMYNQNSTNLDIYSDISTSADTKKTITILFILKLLCPQSSNPKCKWPVLEKDDKMDVHVENNPHPAVTAVRNSTQVAVSQSVENNPRPVVTAVRDSTQVAASQSVENNKHPAVTAVRDSTQVAALHSLPQESLVDDPGADTDAHQSTEHKKQRGGGESETTVKVPREFTQISTTPVQTVQTVQIDLSNGNQANQNQGSQPSKADALQTNNEQSNGITASAMDLLLYNSRFC